ncbi:hypothetical protein QBC44DRAFT_90369 [Cladorrhinum sp. PSN332]|nr:hypothetical protein QBC44DRAFT_90369 [Cladorrhinum sp. PSN332]
MTSTFARAVTDQASNLLVLIALYTLWLAIFGLSPSSNAVSSSQLILLEMKQEYSRLVPRTINHRATRVHIHQYIPTLINPTA